MSSFNSFSVTCSLVFYINISRLIHILELLSLEGYVLLRTSVDNALTTKQHNVIQHNNVLVSIRSVDV